MQTSGQASSPSGTGKTTAEMKTAWTFLSWGSCGNEGIWTIDEAVDYPHLAWEHRSGIAISARLSDLLAGSGSEGDPYLIYTARDIETIASFSCERDKHFRLAFLAGKGTEDDPYLLYTPDEVNLLHVCPYERDAHFRLMFMDGKGSQESPYLVSTGEQLNMIGMLSKEWDKHYKLISDIDLSAFDGKDGRPAFRVIGDCYVSFACIAELGPSLDGTPFTGVFDGNDHTISHLTINSQSGSTAPTTGVGVGKAAH